MRRINFLHLGSMAAALSLLSISGCGREPVSPDFQGRIAVKVTFEDYYAGAQKISRVAEIDRVVATVRVYETMSVEQQGTVGDVILRQPLTIISRPTGRFAEGTLSIPIKDDSCFVITIDAFENGDLAFTGSDFACLNAEVEIGLRPVVPPELRSPGADVIVFADINMLSDALIGRGGNQIFAQNLVNFTGPGANAQSSRIKIYTGHNGTRDPANTPYQSVLSMWRSSDYIIDESSEAPIQTSGYKVIMIFLPGRLGDSPFSAAEIDSLKGFATNGGRLVLVGEWVNFYPASGRQTFNQLLSDLGIGMSITAVRNVQLKERINLVPHQVLTNVTSLYNDATGTFIITDPQTAIPLALTPANADNDGQIDIVLAIGKVQL